MQRPAGSKEKKTCAPAQSKHNQLVLAAQDVIRQEAWLVPNVLFHPSAAKEGRRSLLQWKRAMQVLSAGTQLGSMLNTRQLYNHKAYMAVE